jgi:hypothetical protein
MVNETHFVASQSAKNRCGFPNSGLSGAMFFQKFQSVESSAGVVGGDFMEPTENIEVIEPKVIKTRSLSDTSISFGSWLICNCKVFMASLSSAFLNLAFIRAALYTNFTPFFKRRSFTVLLQSDTDYILCFLCMIDCLVRVSTE